MCNLKAPSPVASSTYRMSLTVELCGVHPASVLVTAEIPGVKAPLASLIPHLWAVDKGWPCLFPHLVLLCCFGTGEAVSASWQIWQTLGIQLLEARPVSAPVLARYSVLS